MMTSYIAFLCSNYFLDNFQLQNYSTNILHYDNYVTVLNIEHPKHSNGADWKQHCRFDVSLQFQLER